MNWQKFRKVTKRLGLVLIQVVVTTGLVVATVYGLCRSERGMVIAGELAKGAIGGMIGGLAVGAFLAFERAGGPA